MRILPAAKILFIAACAFAYFPFASPTFVAPNTFSMSLSTAPEAIVMKTLFA